MVYDGRGSLDRVDRETNQVNQTIAANIGFESKEDAPFGYLLDLGYINFSHKYGLNKNIDGPTEHTLEAKFDLNAGFNGNMRIGLGDWWSISTTTFRRQLLIRMFMSLRIMPR